MFTTFQFRIELSVGIYIVLLRADLVIALALVHGEFLKHHARFTPVQRSQSIITP